MGLAVATGQTVQGSEGRLRPWVCSLSDMRTLQRCEWGGT